MPPQPTIVMVGAEEHIVRFVASGVTSRGAKPVPPVVRIYVRGITAKRKSEQLRYNQVEFLKKELRFGYQLQSSFVGPQAQHPLNVLHFVRHHLTLHHLAIKKFGN